MFQKITIDIVLALLCLNFSAIAQDNKAIDVTSKGLKIGQQVPDLTITNLHNYKDKNGKPATIAKISDFKGKLLILDFWATWCSPCVAMIPKMDSLQKQFGNKLQFISVNYQTEKEVMPFLEKYEKQRNKQYNLTHVLADTELHKFFPHTTLPHYVWIDGNGIIRAITEYREVNTSIITKFLTTGNMDVRKKTDFKIKYDGEKPLLIAGNGGDGSTMFYHTVMTGYIAGLSSGYNYDPEQPGTNRSRHITATNQTIPMLYALAYGEGRRYIGPNRMSVSVKDSTKLFNYAYGQEYINWMKAGNVFSYEVIAPYAQSNQVFQIMQNDLNRSFTQYEIKIKTMPVKCLALVRTSDKDKLYSKGGVTSVDFDKFGCHIRNNYIGQLTSRLDAFFLQSSPYPVVDATGYDGLVDIDINANLSNVADINKALQKYDLRLTELMHNTHMLIINDRK